MTEHPESLAEAIDDRDLTLALTPAQLVLLVVGAFVVLRILRRLRRS